jgi:hypothetical protein
MKRSQWFVFAAVFLLAAIYFQYQGAVASSTSKSMTKENLRELINVEEKNTWTEAFGILHLSKENFANTLFISSNISYSFSNFCWSIFIACMICGWIEHREEKKKKQKVR